MRILKSAFIGVGIVVATLLSLSAQESRRPNVLFVSLDDMNDWVGALGHTQAITPHMDRLAEQGVNFRNAHTAGIFCAPSRTALFTGLHASSTGCYTTQIYFREHPEIKPLQTVFQEGGYATYGGGKLFHHPEGFVDLRGWDEFFVRSEAQKNAGWALDSWPNGNPAIPDPYPNSIYNRDRKPANRYFLEWGKVRNENEGKMADTIRTEWAADLLKKRHDTPFFVGVGLYAPHFPNYAPEKYFDLYDIEEITLPPYKADDLDDLPEKVKKAKTARGRIHQRLESLGAVEDAVLGYLACISYADAMLGRLLDALKSGPNADNTIVILWSDHGYHHGEKYDWGKHTLWERTSNIPLIIAGPGIAKNAKVDTTVSSIDLFPTLTELCSLEDGQARDGISLADTLRNPESAEDRNVLLPGMKPGEYAIINDSWRYIRYEDGGEELYDLKKDPNEWENLASFPEMNSIKVKMRASAPETFAKPGIDKSKLKLITEGTNFRWGLK